MRADLRAQAILSLLPIFAIGLTACGGGEDESSSTMPETESDYEVSSAAIGINDKALLLLESSGGSDWVLDGEDVLFRIDENGDVHVVYFEGKGKKTGRTKRIEVKVAEVRKLSTRYFAIRTSGNARYVLDYQNGRVHHISDGTNLEYMMVDDTTFYYLDETAGIIYKTNLSATSLTYAALNDPNAVAAPGGFAAIAWPTEFSAAAPHQYYPGGRLYESRFILQANGDVLTNTQVGHAMLVNEGQTAYDCWMAVNQLVDVGGGFGHGLIQTADKTLYQFISTTNPMAANRGDGLLKFTFSRSGNCWTRTPFGTQTNISKAEGQTRIYSQVDFPMEETDRYDLQSNGFFHVFDDGAGALDWSWTDLDLSAVPTMGHHSNRLVVLADDWVYWRDNANIRRQHLVPSSTPELVTTAASSVTSIDVADGIVSYSDGTNTYVLKTPGGTPTRIAPGNKIKGSHSRR